VGPHSPRARYPPSGVGLRSKNSQAYQALRHRPFRSQVIGLAMGRGVLANELSTVRKSGWRAGAVWRLLGVAILPVIPKSAGQMPVSGRAFPAPRNSHGLHLATKRAKKASGLRLSPSLSLPCQAHTTCRKCTWYRCKQGRECSRVKFCIPGLNMPL
jgi:hypothetical protein